MRTQLAPRTRSLKGAGILEKPVGFAFAEQSRRFDFRLRPAEFPAVPRSRACATARARTLMRTSRYFIPRAILSIIASSIFARVERHKPDAGLTILDHKRSSSLTAATHFLSSLLLTI